MTIKIQCIFRQKNYNQQYSNTNSIVAVENSPHYTKIEPFEEDVAVEIRTMIEKELVTKILD